MHLSTEIVNEILNMTQVVHVCECVYHTWLCVCVGVSVNCVCVCVIVKANTRASYLSIVKQDDIYRLSNRDLTGRSITYKTFSLLVVFAEKSIDVLLAAGYIFR